MEVSAQRLQTPQFTGPIYGSRYVTTEPNAFTAWLPTVLTAQWRRQDHEAVVAGSRSYFPDNPEVPASVRLHFTAMMRDIFGVLDVTEVSLLVHGAESLIVQNFVCLTVLLAHPQSSAEIAVIDQHVIGVVQAFQEACPPR